MATAYRTLLYKLSARLASSLTRTRALGWSKTVLAQQSRCAAWAVGTARTDASLHTSVRSPLHRSQRCFGLRCRRWTAHADLSCPGWSGCFAQRRGLSPRWPINGSLWCCGQWEQHGGRSWQPPMAAHARWQSAGGRRACTEPISALPVGVGGLGEGWLGCR